ncbi:acyltransferase family protein [Enterobacter soli]|uniref:acyltransferase family protein n=1 Tax=Enterobacter soli TaxID=885040 RepID=UPI0034CEF8E8
MNHESFRYDINTLRAASVIMVVLYHFKVSGFASGFMGVDIFFAISGYLMTNIINKGITCNNLSIIDFYIRRFKRLYPALIVMISAVIALGYFTLTTNNYLLLARNALSSSFFVSNIFYFLHSGYFDQSSLLNWLLHTWSLSVEWQFYLIYPVLLFTYSKISRKPVSLIVLLLGISIYFSSSMTFDTKDSGYYLLHTRAWEMLAGGLAYFINTNLPSNFRYAKLASYTGWLSIIISLIMIPANAIWPGYLALIPVTGACVILSTNAQHNVVYRNIATIRIGLYSYSIYLWHWPIVVFLYSSGLLGSWMYVLAGIILSVLMGFLSFTFIESSTNRKFIITSSVTAIPVLLIACLIIINTDGLKFRVGDKLKDILSYRMNWDAQRNGTCFLTPNQHAEDFIKCKDSFDEQSILIWGDSHAAQLIPGFEKLNIGNKDIVQRTASMCPPVVDVDFESRPYCRGINNYILREIKNNRPDTVILAASWTGYLNIPIVGYLDRTIKKIKVLGVKHIYIIGTVPIWKANLPTLIELNGMSSVPMLSRVNVVESSFTTDEKMRKFFSESSASYISLIDSMCDQKGCYTVPEDSTSAPMQWDIGHLTEPGSNYISKVILRSMN